MAKDGTSSNNKRAREEDNAEVVVVGDDHPPSTLPEIQERIRQLIARSPSKEETARLSVDNIPAMERWCKTVRKITRDYNLSLNFVAIANYQVNLIKFALYYWPWSLWYLPPLTWFHYIYYLFIYISGNPTGNSNFLHPFDHDLFNVTTNLISLHYLYLYHRPGHTGQSLSALRNQIQLSTAQTNIVSNHIARVLTPSLDTVSN